MAALRKWLFTGLLVIVPGVITAWVLTWIVSTLDQTLTIHVRELKRLGPMLMISSTISCAGQTIATGELSLYA